MNRLALYYRASNEDEGFGESATIQNQRDLLQNYVKTQGEFFCWSIQEFQDDGWSGTTFERPGIQKLLELAGTEIQCIIVKDFSRFGRNLIDVGNYLDQVFPFLGVRFIAVNEGYDSKNYIGRAIGLEVSLKAMVYEAYSRDLSKKISSVKEEQMRKGRYTGNWAFYGYRRTKTGTSGLAIDPQAAETVRKIFSLAAQGIKTAQIAVILNREGVLPPLRYRKEQNPTEGYCCPTATSYTVWTQGRISTIIRDERYTGVLISRKRQRIDLATKKQKPVDSSEWIRAEQALEAIVTRQAYEQAQKILKHRKKQSAASMTELFRGLLKCGHCGKALAKVPVKAPYFRCETGRFHPDMPCARIHIDKQALEGAVRSSLWLGVLLVLKTGQASEINTGGERAALIKLEKLKCRVKKEKTQQAILFEGLVGGRVSRTAFATENLTIEKRLRELADDQEALQKELQEHRQTQRGEPAQDFSRKTLLEAVKCIRVFPGDRIEITYRPVPLE